MEHVPHEESQAPIPTLAWGVKPKFWPVIVILALALVPPTMGVTPPESIHGPS